MSKGKIDFDVLGKAYKSAPMSENTVVSDGMKKKLISISEDWASKIKKHYKGTLNSYITMAIFERMQKDGML